MRKNLAYDRELSRWYPLREHPVQQALITDDVRFKIVPAGRRSGKTERAKRHLVRTAMRVPGDYFAAAPTYSQVKRLYWRDLKLLSMCSAYPQRPSESELVIRYPNGSTISLIGLDKPERMEGTAWAGGVIDEIADVKSTAWAENISPALDTIDPRRPGYRAWCWLIGVPDGLNHYYDMVLKARAGTDPDWREYSWPSSDILPPDVVESARRRMSPRQFRQEYEASFEGATGRIYDDYGRENITDAVLMPHEQIMWCHDFNFTPMSSCIAVRRGNSLYIVGEIILASATARQSALEFIDRYANHGNKSVLIYGDPAGRAGEKHGHESDYTGMESVLRAAGWTVQRRVKRAAPAIRDRQNAVRAKILNAAGERTLFVNPSLCEYVHKGLATVQLKPGSAFLEVDGDYQHITTAVGYCIDYEWPINAPLALVSVQFPT